MAKRSIKAESVFKTIKERLERGTYLKTPFPSERKLAQQLGVSHATARKAVKEAIATGILDRNDSGRITIPHQNQSSLRFSLICPGESAPWLMDWTKSIRLVASRHAAQLSTYHYVDSHDTILTDALIAECDLYFLVPPTPMSRVVKDLIRDKSRRICTIFSDITDLGVPRIDNSSELGIDLLLDHLRNLGHSRIACINCEDDWQKSRVHRYEAYCEKNKLTPIVMEQTKPIEWISQLRGYRLMNQIINEKANTASAFLFTSISPCQGALRACYEHGIQPGKDLSICGFGPSNRSRLMIPSLTSLQVPSQETVVNGAVEAMLTGSTPPSPETWVPTLFEGESTGPHKD